jgi:hypothetical protein
MTVVFFTNRMLSEPWEVDAEPSVEHKPVNQLKNTKPSVMATRKNMESPQKNKEFSLMGTESNNVGNMETDNCFVTDHNIHRS